MSASFLRWDHKASTTISKEGEKGVVEYKLDRWTGRTWIEAYLITSEGPAVVEQLASSPPSGGEGWAKSERDFLTALWLDLLILCAAWLLATLKKWLPKITPKSGRRAVIAALVGLIAVNSALGYAWIWYYQQGQANLRLLEAHRMWQAAYDRAYREIMSSAAKPVSRAALEERRKEFRALEEDLLPKRFTSFLEEDFKEFEKQLEKELEAMIQAEEAAERYTRETTGIAGAGSFSVDYINSVLADIGDAKRQLLRMTMHFSVICMALIIVLRAMMGQQREAPGGRPQQEPPQG